MLRVLKKGTRRNKGSDVLAQHMMHKDTPDLALLQKAGPVLEHAAFQTLQAGAFFKISILMGANPTFL